MLLELKIKLSSHFLGGEPKDHRGVRCLKRKSKEEIEIDSRLFLRNLEKASKDLGYDVDLSNSVKLPTSFYAPTVRLVKRTYQAGRTDTFEGFVKNSEITFLIVLDNTVEKAPTLQQLQNIMSIMGQFYGYSQFGMKFGLGRFDVIHLKPRFAEQNEE